MKDEKPKTDDRRVRRLRNYRAALARAVEKLPAGYAEAAQDRDAYVKPVESVLAALGEGIESLEKP